VNSVSQKEKPNAEKPDVRRSEAERSKPSPAPAPATVALASGPPKITKGSQQDQPPDVAPSLAIGGASSDVTSSLARPVSAPTPTIMAQSDLVNAKALRAVPAVYPVIAKARRLSGTVVVRVTVGKDGKPRNLRYISGPTIFQDAAFEAAKQWLFQPATLNGAPIEQDTEIRMSFKPS